MGLLLLLHVLVMLIYRQHNIFCLPGVAFPSLVSAVCVFP